MVHALREAWRVLIPGGTLLDWRPVHGNWTLELLFDRQVRSAGFMDDSPKRLDDLAADQAVEQVVGEGWFARERRQSFDYAWYWENVSRMKTHLEEPEEEEWRPPICLPDAVWAEAQRLVADHSEGPKVRVQIKMRMAQYRKQQTGFGAD